MHRFYSFPRGRTLIVLGLIVLALYLLLSLRRVEEGKGQAVLDSPLLPLRARLLRPGWVLVPPGFLRISVYSESARRIPFHLPSPGKGRLVSSEGVGVEVEGSLTYRVRTDTLPDLHARARGNPGRRVVEPLLEGEILEAIRSASFTRISGAHRFELEAALAGRLGPALRRSGLAFVNLRIDAVRMAGGSLGGVSLAPIPGTRVLVIGLDGADWRVMDPLLERGKLPNLARLMAGGVRARLKTIDPVLSPVVWTTAATGFLPSEHGILDFLATDLRTGERVPVTSRQRKVKAIWNLLDEAGVSVGVIGWWATWPAEPVDGYIVSDRVAYQLMGQGRMGDGDPRGKTFPSDLFRKIHPLVIPPETITDSDLAPFIRLGGVGGEELPPRSEDRLDEFRTVLAASRTYEGIAEALASGGMQPFEAIYFEGIDTTSHLFMPFRPPRRPHISAEDFHRFSGAVDAFYAYQDEVLGRILAKTPPGTNILLLSDHGFRSEGDRPVRESRIEYATAALWHRKHGILVAHGSAFRKDARISEASILDITPTILAVYGLPVGEDMQGRPIVELFDPEFLKEHPVRYRPSWETRGAVRASSEISDPAGDKALKEKLLSLGYLSQEGTLSRNNLGNSLLAQGDTAGAIREFRKAVEEAPGFPLPRINLARALLAGGDRAAARKLLEDAVRQSPEFLEAEVLLANVEREEGRGAESEARLRKVLAKEPSALAHRSLGLLYYGQGKKDPASVEFRKAIDLDPEDPESYNNLGVILKEQGHPEEAEVQFRRAVEIAPDFAGSYNNLALIAMDREDWEAARPLLKQALDRAPGDPMIRNNLGNLLLHLGRIPEAEAEYRKALALRSDYAEPHNGLGSIQGRKGNRPEEMAEYRKALEIDPRYVDARANLARALLAVSDYRGAVEICGEGVSLRPESVLLWNLLGEASFRAGDGDGARKAFQNSLDRDPRQPEIRSRFDSIRRERP